VRAWSETNCVRHTPNVWELRGLKHWLENLTKFTRFSVYLQENTLLPRSWLHTIVFILNLITDATMSKQSHFCNVDNLLSERSQNNVDYTTSIIRRQGDVETTSIFSRSTSWLHFDEISMSKWCCVPAGIPSKILSRCY
jgi:hypothetical protein